MAATASLRSAPPHIQPPMAHAPNVIAETERPDSPSCLYSIDNSVGILQKLFRPAHRIPWIFYLQRLGGRHQRMESIHHHGQLFGLFRPDAALNGAGMRPMGNATWMQGEHSAGDMLTAHEVAVHIIEQLVTVDITVIIRRRDSLRVVVE